MFGRSKRKHNDSAARTSGETDRTAVEQEKAADHQLSKAQIKRATRTRKIFCLLTSFLLLLAVIFMILVEVGNTSASDSVRNSTYFIRIDLSNIIPQTVPNAALVNSIARTLGLHDFYQVGLWNYCSGYNDEGVVFCSKPTTLYWFNPVEIITGELLAGATIALPSDVTDILNIIRLASEWMFGLFLAGACLAFIMIFIAPLAIFSRWAALFTSILTFIAAFFITAASVVATVMFIIMRNAFTSVQELNISGAIGIKMFVFMWIASGTALIAALIQIGECCCCASRRDVKTGRKRGSKKAYNGDGGDFVSDKPAKKRGFFGRRR